MKRLQKDCKRVVIKIGSSLFCSGNKLDLDILHNLTEEVSSLICDKGREIVIVSSGAIALGMNIMNLRSRPRDLQFLQAAAAIGQSSLMDNYSRLFKKFQINCAQVLLTWEDFDDRKRYLNAKNTLTTLLKLKTIPIINENDTVSTGEIKFGDNDRLSGMVASLICADILIILSDVDGLLQKDRKTLVNVVPDINSSIKELACPTDKKTCVGGMISKIEAAKIAVESGIPCVIANGRRENIISDIIKEPAARGNWTIFLPKKGYLEAKKCWLAFSAKSKGKIFVDDGAKDALVNRNKSLLGVGIISFDGEFDAADTVSILDKTGIEFAKGVVSCSWRELEKLIGKKNVKEVIHRDKLVII